MEHSELAREMAELEGVEQLFDSMVREMIEAGRGNHVRRMLNAPGRAPSVVMKQTQTMESGLEKFDHNLRSQYGEFLSSYVATRETLFTQDQLAGFVSVLREPKVQEYLATMRNFRKELREPLRNVMNQLMRQALVGSRGTFNPARPSVSETAAILPGLDQQENPNSVNSDSSSKSGGV